MEEKDKANIPSRIKRSRGGISNTVLRCRGLEIEYRK